MTERHYPPQSPVSVGLAGRCPRCGQGKLFKGLLAVAPRCEACDLDFSFADAGDGPAVFVTLIAGFLILGAAVYVEFTYEPPIWVHVMLWGPLILLVCTGLLRLIKGVLIALQYVNRAAEGRLES
ncbi:MAG: DUF983 domain-containing protein [Labrys sp. (in: a-proteobacteria)]